MESQAIRRFVLHAGSDGRAKGLLVSWDLSTVQKTPMLTERQLWVFNPALLYLSSRSTAMPHIGMKIFYQSVEDPQKLLEEQSNLLEELFIPAPILQEFITMLTDSTNLLPQSARGFQEWTVGLLERYRREPISKESILANFKPLFTSLEKDKENERFKAIFTKEIEAQFKPLYD